MKNNVGTKLTSLFILIIILFYPIKSNPDIANAKNLSEGMIVCKNNQSPITYKIQGNPNNKIYRISKAYGTYIDFYEDETKNEPISKTNYNVFYQKYSSQQLYFVVRFTYDSDCLSFIYFDSVNGVYINENQNFSLPFAASLDEYTNIKIKDNYLNQNLIQIQIKGASHFYYTILSVKDSETKNYTVNKYELTLNYFPNSNEISLNIKFNFGNTQNGVAYVSYNKMGLVQKVNQNLNVCSENPQKSIYYLIYNENIPYYDVSFTNGIYFYENSNIQSGKFFKGILSSSVEKYVDFRNGGCLQILFNQNNQITLDKNNFSFQIYESREFKFEIKDDLIKNNRVNVILSSNLFQINKFYFDKIEQKYFIANNEQTQIIYHFYPNSNSLTVNTSFIYKENNMNKNEINIKYEIPNFIELNKDTFTCYNIKDGEYKFFKILYNSKKEYIDISSNGQLLVYDGKTEENINYDNRKISSVFYVELSGSNPCLQLFFFQFKNEITLEKSEFAYKIFNNRRITYYLDDNTIKNNMVNIIFSSSKSFEINEMKVDSENKIYFLSNQEKTKVIYHNYFENSYSYIIPSFIYKANNENYDEIIIKYEIAEYKEITDDIIDECYNLNDGEFKLFKIKYNPNKSFVDFSFNKKQLVYSQKKEKLIYGLSYNDFESRQPVFFEIRGKEVCMTLNFLTEQKRTLIEKEEQILFFYFDETFDLFIKGSLDDEIELTLTLNNEKSSINVTEKQMNFIKITRNMNDYILHFILTQNTQTISLLVKTDSKVQIKISYKKITHYFRIILIIVLILVFLIIIRLCYLKGKEIEKKQQELIEIKRNKKNEKKKKEKEEKDALIKKYEKYYEIVSKKPEELSRICPICLKNEYNEDVLEDSAFNNLDPIFSNKEEYLENVRNEINKPDFEGVISYLNNNNKCCHFYHEECKKRGKNKNNCYFCNYYISITNIIVFQEIDKISFVNVMKFIHNLSEKCECNYKKNVINAVYDFIQNDETFDEKLKEEIKKRHKLARKFINNLNYKSTF